MCLSTVYEVRDGSERVLCEYTTTIALDGALITLTDIMGDQIVVTGVLKSVDLVKNIIKIEM